MLFTKSYAIHVLKKMTTVTTKRTKHTLRCTRDSSFPGNGVSYPSSPFGNLFTVLEHSIQAIQAIHCKTVISHTTWMHHKLWLIVPWTPHYFVDERTGPGTRSMITLTKKTQPTRLQRVKCCRTRCTGGLQLEKYAHVKLLPLLYFVVAPAVAVAVVQVRKWVQMDIPNPRTHSGEWISARKQHNEPRTLFFIFDSNPPTNLFWDPSHSEARSESPSVARKWTPGSRFGQVCWWRRHKTLESTTEWKIPVPEPWLCF